MPTEYVLVQPYEDDFEDDPDWLAEHEHERNEDTTVLRTLNFEDEDYSFIRGYN
jgi:hypothetical protein